MTVPPQSLQVPSLVGDAFLYCLGTKDSFKSSSKVHSSDSLTASVIRCVIILLDWSINCFGEAEPSDICFKRCSHFAVISGDANNSFPTAAIKIFAFAVA